MPEPFIYHDEHPDWLRENRDLGLWRPVARDVAKFRHALMPYWLPGAPFSEVARIVAERGRHNFVPQWEAVNLYDAALWFVGPDMCELLNQAAPSMPATPLRKGDVPDRSGFVVFARPLMGIDADGDETKVAVGGYLWGPGKHVVSGEGIGISCYGPHIWPDSGWERPWMQPLGGCIWPYGETADVALVDDPVTAASMAEDRRFLQALWYLAAQPNLTRSIRHEPVVRNKAKKRRGAKAPDPVRVVHLRHQVRAASASPEPSGREFTVRWMVRGHWRNQAYGPHHSLRRPLFIHPYLKGPEGAPVVEHVKAL